MSYEIIGLSGTLMILLAFLCNSEIKIRFLDGLGAVLFVAYGILIHSPSTYILNGILIIIQAVKIYRLRSRVT